MRVCKSWHTLITTIPRFWYHLDLSDAPLRLGPSSASSKRLGSVTNDFVSLCIKRSQNRIRSAHLQGLKSREKVIYALASSCKELDTITLAHSTLYCDALVKSILPARALKRLDLACVADFTFDGLCKIISACPLLEHLVACPEPGSASGLSWHDRLKPSPNLHHLQLQARSTEPPVVDVSRYILTSSHRHTNALL